MDTNVPMLNVALSGKFDGGVTHGHTVFAGKPAHFKTAFGMTMIAAYLNHYDDGAALFYDSEFTPPTYFTEFGVDTDRVFHTPAQNMEQLKTDMVNQIEGIERSDHAIIMIDSLTNIASLKELEDAKDGKTVADMTRAKAVKALFRMITSELAIRDIPLITINHTYDTLDFYSKEVVSGGKGITFSADTILIISKAVDEKEGTEPLGHRFTLNVNKSRFIREKVKIPITVSYEGGINKWSGLLDVALEGGYVHKPKQGWYEAIDPSTGEVLSEKSYRAKETNSEEFWNPVLERTNFKQYVENKYKLTQKEYEDNAGQPTED